jgi:hypothetical protein
MNRITRIACGTAFGTLTGLLAIAAVPAEPSPETSGVPTGEPPPGASAEPAAQPSTETSAETSAEPAVPTVDAVWIEHKKDFIYFGQTTYYSCHGLQDKVEYLMKQAGARPDNLQVRVTCMESYNYGVESMPRVRIKATMPTEATPELLQMLADDPKRELIARVRGEGDQLDLATAQFPAVRTVVEFDGRRGRIEDGDCELLDQMIRNVFAPMGIRVLEGSRLHCMRASVPVGSVMLKLETLQKAPDPDTAPEKPEKPEKP